MKKTNLFFFIFVLVAMTGYAVSLAEARDSSPQSASSTTSSPEALILDPGMVSSCQNDFVIENLDGGSVDIKIALGNEEWMNDSIKPMESKAYGLQGGISQAQMEGKRVSSSDVATIFNIDDMARIRVHCVE